MNVKEFKGKILQELPNYTEEEMKELVPLLLSKIEEVVDRKNDLSASNKELNDQITKLEKQLNDPDVIKSEAISEAKNILDNARVRQEEMLNSAKSDANKILEDANKESDEIIAKSILKVQNTVVEIERIEQQQKIFRSNILSLFKKNIFKFANTEYYFVKAVDPDLQELLSFFEKDERIKRIYEKNQKKLKTVTDALETFNPIYDEVEEEMDAELTSEEKSENDKQIDDCLDGKEGDVLTREVKDINDVDKDRANENKLNTDSVSHTKDSVKKKKSKSFLDLINSLNESDQA